MSAARPTLLAALVAALLAPSGAYAEGGEPAPPFLGWPTPEADAERPAAGARGLHDAATLGQGTLAIGGGLGFPYLFLEAGAGLTDGLDLRLDLRTVYGATTEAGLVVRGHVWGPEDGLALALTLGADARLVEQDETGLLLVGGRDVAAGPGLALSYPLGARALAFAEAVVSLALDLDPASVPLGGPPDAFELFVNLPLTAGIELPVGDALRLAVSAGLEVRLGARTPGEPRVLPRVALALDLAG